MPQNGMPWRNRCPSSDSVEQNRADRAMAAVDPAPANLLRVLDSFTLRIGIDLFHDLTRELEASPVDRLVRLHRVSL